MSNVPEIVQEWSQYRAVARTANPNEDEREIVACLESVSATLLERRLWTVKVELEHKRYLISVLKLLIACRAIAQGLTAMDLSHFIKTRGCEI